MMMSKPQALTGTKVAEAVSASVMPAPLKAMGLVKTGPYLHAPEHKSFIEFKGGELPRSFTVILAVANMADGMRLDRNGIAVIDNDNWAVIADQIGAQPTGIRGASTEQKQAFAKIADMNWAEFSHLLRNAKTFRAGKASDIDEAKATPETGNYDRQARLGLRNPAERDLRDDFMRAIDTSGDYRLPYASRRTMINDLLLHPATDTRNGQCLSWSVGMEGFSWNSTGHVAEGEETHAALDANWEKELRENPAILEQAVENFLTPYVRDSFSALEMEGAESSLDLIGGDTDKVVLRQFNGSPLEFGSRRELRASLDAMSDNDLSHLWATVRVLDMDLSRSVRGHQIALELNSLRAEMEVEWLKGEQEADLDLYDLAS